MPSATEQKYKVLVIPAWFDHKDPSAGIFIDEFCEIMNKSGAEITLLYLNFVNLRSFWKLFFTDTPELNKNYNTISIRLLNLKSSLLFFLSNQWILNFYSSRVIKTLKKINFDVIHIQSLCNNITPYISAELAKAKKIKYIVTEHYSSYDLAKGKMFKPFMTEKKVKEIAGNAYARTSVSASSALFLKNYFGCDFIPVSNFINELFFTQKAKSEKNKKFTFVIIAPLEPHKGVIQVIKAFKRLRETDSETSLVIVGKGSLKKEATVLSGSNHNTITLIDSLNREGLIDLLDSCHCLISASDYETFGLTLVEANLRGLPVISTKSGGPQELLNGTNGILIELKNREDGLLQAMQQMIKNYLSYNSVFITETTKNKFDSQIIAKKYLEIYHSSLL